MKIGNEKTRRSRLETIDAILNLCTKEMKKTHIMYQANLSHLQLEKYLEILLKMEFLKKNENQYVITDKGLDFIKEFKKFQSVMEDIELKSTLPVTL